jgi:hypothetical protein
MEVTRATVRAEREWVHDRADEVVPLANAVRADLAAVFDTEVPPISPEAYHEAVDSVFADEPRAVNAATLVALLRDLDVADDYPGFVIDEYLGRELAAIVAGEQPLRLLAEATFHYADLSAHGGSTAGADDLDAALAAGVQTRIPGWQWREGRFGAE